MDFRVGCTALCVGLWARSMKVLEKDAWKVVSISKGTRPAKQPQTFNIISGEQLAYLSNPEQQQLIGIIQALVIGGSSCTWKDDLTEVLLGLQALKSKIKWLSDTSSGSLYQWCST